MGDLALTYSALQMHNDALEMGKSVLEFRRRVLHENHPDIGKNCVLFHSWFVLAICVIDLQPRPWTI